MEGGVEERYDLDERDQVHRELRWIDVEHPMQVHRIGSMDEDKDSALAAETWLDFPFVF